MKFHIEVFLGNKESLCKIERVCGLLALHTDFSTMTNNLKKSRKVTFDQIVIHPCCAI